MKFSMNTSESDPYPFAAGGGLDTPPMDSEDPYERLDDLMSIIEALCPTWSHREPFAAEGLWRM